MEGGQQNQHSIRFIRSMGKDSKGNFFHPCDNAEAFFVIE
jgi:hypothetical protein